jgi:hypothetical protein
LSYERQENRNAESEVFSYEDFVKADESIAKTAFSDCLVSKGRNYRSIPDTLQSCGV